jgi:hypothetical protein
MIATLRNDIWEIRWGSAQPGYVAAQYMNGGPNCNGKISARSGMQGRSIELHSELAPILDLPWRWRPDTDWTSAISVGSPVGTSSFGS